MPHLEIVDGLARSAAGPARGRGAAVAADPADPTRGGRAGRMSDEPETSGATAEASGSPLEAPFDRAFEATQALAATPLAAAPTPVQPAPMTETAWARTLARANPAFDQGANDAAAGRDRGAVVASPGTPVVEATLLRGAKDSTGTSGPVAEGGRATPAAMLPSSARSDASSASLPQGVPVAEEAAPSHGVQVERTPRLGVGAEAAPPTPATQRASPLAALAGAGSEPATVAATPAWTRNAEGQAPDPRRLTEAHTAPVHVAQARAAPAAPASPSAASLNAAPVPAPSAFGRAAAEEGEASRADRRTLDRLSAEPPATGAPATGPRLRDGTGSPTPTAQGPASGQALGGAQTLAAARPSAASEVAVLQDVERVERTGGPQGAEIGALGTSAAGAPTTTLATTTPAVGATPPAAQAVAEQAVGLARRETPGEVEIRLDPPELGRVRLSLSRHDHVLVVSIVAERPEVSDLLRRHADVLGQSLADAGHARVDLQFGRGGSEGRAPGGGGAALAEPAAGEPPPSPVPSPAAGRGLDLRV